MSPEEIKKCIETTKELIAYQSKVDDVEDVKKLPELKLEEIPTKINITHSNVVEKDDFKFIYHEVSTNKIAYMRLYFDLNVLDIEELAYARILARLFVKLDTKNFTADKLQSFIKTYLGNISFSPVVNAINKEEYIAKMLVSVSSLEENITYIPLILNEVINNTIYDENKIKTILVQMKNRERSAIIENGTSAATTIIRSQLSKEGVLTAKMSGLNMYNLLCELTENFSLETIEKLKAIANKIFNKDNLIVSIGGDKETLRLLTDNVYKLDLNYNGFENKMFVEYKKEESDALVIPSGVNCNVKGINLTDIGYELNGSLYVVQHILNYDYLWPEVRVKGGAYGCSLSLSLSNDIVLGSFSDPNVLNTYNVYDNIAQYLENFNPTPEEFNSYIIGTIAKIDPPASIYSKVCTADKNLLCGVGIERLEKLKEEILITNIETVRSYSELFKKIAQQGIIFTIGNEEKINEFSQLTSIKKLV